MVDTSYFYVRSDNNEPEGEIYNSWLADMDEKKFLRNPKLAELQYDENGLWGRDVDDRDWHRLHEFDEPKDIAVVALQYVLAMYGADRTVTYGWSRPAAPVHPHRYEQYVEWRGNRFYWTEGEGNQLRWSHIFWTHGSDFPEVNAEILGKDMIHFLEWHNILEW